MDPQDTTPPTTTPADPVTAPAAAPAAPRRWVRSWRGGVLAGAALVSLSLAGGTMLASSGWTFGSDGDSSAASVAVDLAPGVSDPDMPMMDRGKVAASDATTSTTSSDTGSADTSRSVVRTASAVIAVDDQDQARTDFMSSLRAVKGTVLAENRSRGAGGAADQSTMGMSGVKGMYPMMWPGWTGEPYITWQVQVPADDLDAFLRSVAQLGTVHRSTESSNDYTAYQAQTSARAKALTASVTRLKELMAKATDLSDVLAIEEQLQARQAELDGLNAELRSIAEQVAQSTVDVTVSTERGAAELAGEVSPGDSGWDRLLATVGNLWAGAGVLLFWTSPVWIAIIAIRRRDRRVGGHGA